VGNGLWDVQNRARALDNTMYVVAPNPAGYYLTPESTEPIDVTGGESMIVDYQGRVISKHHSGGTASYAGGIIDIEAQRQYRARSLWGNWLRDLRTEQYRIIYDKPMYEKKHAENDKVVRAATERLFEEGIWIKPAYMRNAEE
jgi:predicted amidohydrolase